MGRTYCEESSSLYWEVYHEMNGTKQKNIDKGIKKRGRFSNKPNGKTTSLQS